MAGDWIKLEKDLVNKPEVCAISHALDINVYETVGRLHCLWSWADGHTTDGYLVGVREADIDRIVGLPGFAIATSDQGWLDFDARGVLLPNFKRHNSAPAKQRAQKSKNTAVYRQKKQQTQEDEFL